MYRDTRPKIVIYVLKVSIIVTELSLVTCFFVLLMLGPLPTTLGDFWRMIWEKRITNLVMLTGVVEGGKVGP